ncbi:L-histidine N(alpha)-methyltransferase [Mucilaginibacter ginkgonis]|uniref:L-histidine N(Alpha)-methyltransferase n=1 Tax=Mucilaginibacter ginkgonis TaxID=2682091 RepID=A0A6I4I2J6_9SPHI|nr:L-histidine N(alpha)-methyltransferase [Mucilaginibacter ginkgonis]QQL48987.1 L-histidine N(alpha)-methyltransferase [Mucilaginibacter ginkgonis]
MDHTSTQTIPEQSKSANQQFCDDVLAGLTAMPKHLDSKYFYDTAGDKLFQQIMACDEYYPTECEMEIFTRQTADIAEVLKGDGSPFNLIELGAGDATKSVNLLRELLNSGTDFTYMPIDISPNVISQLEDTLPKALPSLQIEGFPGEYFNMLKKAASANGKRNVVLFLGSNIGNMPVSDADFFCKLLHAHLSSGDMVFIGFDLKKNPKVILAAYNDSQGITKQFNLNLLTRINRELGADFDLPKFEHYPIYDPETGSCRSYLFSLVEQQVNICDESISFAKNELIYMEVSQKYSVDEVKEMATKANFTSVTDFYDSRGWFLDTIWVV